MATLRRRVLALSRSGMSAKDIAKICNVAITVVLAILVARDIIDP